MLESLTKTRKEVELFERGPGWAPRKTRTSPTSKKAFVGDGEPAALVATVGKDLAGPRDRDLLG